MRYRQLIRLRSGQADPAAPAAGAWRAPGSAALAALFALGAPLSRDEILGVDGQPDAAVERGRRQMAPALPTQATIKSAAEQNPPPAQRAPREAAPKPRAEPAPSPPAQPAAAAEPPVEQKPPAAMERELRLQPLLSLSHISSRDNATGGVARLRSQLSPGARLEGLATWRGLWLLRFSGELRAASYGMPATSQATLTPASAWPAAARIGAGILVQQRLQLMAVAGLQRQLFVSALASRRFALATILLPEVGLGLGTQLWRANAVKVDAELTTLFIGGHRSAGSGSSVGLRLDASWALSGALALSCSGGWSRRQQGTSLTSQTESLGQLGVGLGWSL